MEHQLAQALNRDCHCVSVDRQALYKSLEAHLRDSGLPERLLGEFLGAHSRLFADSPVFLWQGHIREMAQLIRAVEEVTHNSAYRDTVLSTAPVHARTDHGPRGVFSSYDFHLGADGPKLIEINTNAGGVLLNLYLASAQRACCNEVGAFFDNEKDFDDAEHELISMFKQEWRLQRADKPLHTIAIVDDTPSSQFLYPELLLFQSLFQRHGFDVVIADPGDFTIRNDALLIGNRKIDLIYNRLTDFYFEASDCTCLLEAYQRGLAVVSPSPHIYSLYADKRNLPLLSDTDRLREFGVTETAIDTLGRTLPATVNVSEDNAAQLWTQRKRLFFKPATGYGSRGAYRGAKLTRRVWDDIIHADYIAQAIVVPSERKLIINGESQTLKLDIRCVTYNGEIQQLSARLYKGQTTNLRTEGGGLATVLATRSGGLS